MLCLQKRRSKQAATGKPNMDMNDEYNMNVTCYIRQNKPQTLQYALRERLSSIYMEWRRNRTKSKISKYSLDS
jgi:hypothetical protein